MTALPKEITINDIKYIRADSIENIKDTNIIYIGDSSLLEIYPHDLPKTMTYVDAVKAVEKIGDGWRIPALEELRLMYKNKDAIGGFTTKSSSGSVYPVWYWSSTENRDYPSCVHGVRFSGGNESWNHKDNLRLSVRPVRLVAASAPTPAPKKVKSSPRKRR